MYPKPYAIHLRGTIGIHANIHVQASCNGDELHTSFELTAPFSLTCSLQVHAKILHVQSGFASYSGPV